MTKFKEWISNINAKRVVKLIALLFGLLLIIITSVLSVVFDPLKLNFNEWIGNSVLLVGIMIYGLLIGESIGSDYQQEDKNKLYQKNLSKYNTLNAELNPLFIYFSQFYNWYRLKDLRQKKIDYLKEHYVDLLWAEKIVDNCSEKDIYQLQQREGLKLPNGKVIPQQNPEQIEAIKYIFSGKIKLNDVKENYYLTALGTSRSRYETEEPKEIDIQIRFNRHFNRVFKIIISLIISLVWATLTVRDFMGGEDEVAKMQGWVNLVSRITALITSFVSGWASAVIDTKLKARKLEGKYKMLINFKSAYEKGEFTALNAEEIAIKKYEEEMSKVITPEVVEDNTITKIEMKGE